MPTPTREERIFNPGGIDRVEGVTWKGQDPDQTKDRRFVVFQGPLWGIRALARVLLTYSRVYPQDDPRDIDTVREIISRWAPGSENDTWAYITHVSRLMGVGPDDPIDVTDESVMVQLVKAIVDHENGRVNYPDELIKDGVRRALA